MGFVYKKKSGNLGLKGGEEGEREGSLVRLGYSENKEKWREFAREKKRKNVGEKKIVFLSEIPQKIKVLKLVKGIC